MIDKFDQIEANISDGSEFSIIPPEDVIAFNELRSCYELFRLKIADSLDTDPSYQRDFIWKDADQTRFIDSLNKGLPIPSMCLSYDYKNEIRQVIDGQQRITTIVRFFSEETWRLSSLEDIDPRLSGKTVSEIRRDNPEIIKRIENVTVPITVLRCDLSKQNHLEYIYTIFHRLNVGGVKLSNQEIRNAIFQGPYNDFLKNASIIPELSQIYGKSNKNDRFKKIELVLRFFAFFHDKDNYKGKLNVFLNNFMFKRRFADEIQIQQDMKLLQNVSNLVSQITPGKTEDTKARSYVYIESLMYGVANNIDSLSAENIDILKDTAITFLNSEIFSDGNILEGTMKKDKVFLRLETARALFNSN